MTDEYNLIDVSDIVHMVDYSCHDKYYRDLLLEFLKRKYFGNGCPVFAFYRIYTCSVEDISVETYPNIHPGQVKNRTVTFKVNTDHDTARVRRGDGLLGTLPLFCERVYRFVGIYIKDTVGFLDKELIDNILKYLGEMVLTFESFIINGVGNKLSYGAMRIDMSLYHNSVILYR